MSMPNLGYEIIKRLGTTGVFTDYFDEQGIDYICFDDLSLNRPDSFIFGRVRTINCEDGDFDDENISLGLGYLDKLNVNDILIVKGSDKWAYFGELMSTLSSQRNLSAAIVFGKTRDSRFAKNIFPVWAKGFTPVDIKGRGRVSHVGSPLDINGNEVHEDMMCVADGDGVVFFEKLPQSAIEELRDILIKEQAIIDMINSDATVEDILNFTPSF